MNKLLVFKTFKNKIIQKNASDKNNHLLLMYNWMKDIPDTYLASTTSTYSQPSRIWNISHVGQKTRSKYSHSPRLNPKVYCIQATVSHIITRNSFPMPTHKTLQSLTCLIILFLASYFFSLLIDLKTADSHKERFKCKQILENIFKSPGS